MKFYMELKEIKVIEKKAKRYLVVNEKSCLKLE